MLLTSIAVGMTLSGCSTTDAFHVQHSDIRDDQACISLLNGARQWHLNTPRALAHSRQWKRIATPPAIVERKVNEELAFEASLEPPPNDPYGRSAWFYSSKDVTYGACAQMVRKCFITTLAVWTFPMKEVAQWRREGKKMTEDEWIAFYGTSTKFVCPLDVPTVPTEATATETTFR